MAAELQQEESGFVKKGKGFHLICRPGSKTLIVFFSGTGKKNGTFDFWGAGHRSPENVLFVNDAKNWWYQDGVQGLGAGIDATINSIYRFRDMVGADRIVAVGASMGGYGAVLYGALMDADVLAFSFDSILRLPTSPSEKHMRSDAPVVHADILPIVKASGSHIQIYAGEMYTMDIVAAERMAELPNVTVTTLRGVEHDTARHLNLTIGIDKFLEAMVSKRLLPTSALQGSLVHNKTIVDAIHEAHIAFHDSLFDKCAEVAKACIDVDQLNEPAHFLLGKALVMLNRPADAACHLGLVAAALPDYEHAQFFFAYALRLAKQHLAAVDLFEKQALRWPTARVFCSIAFCRESLRQYDQAIIAMNRTVEIDANYKSKGENMMKRIATKIAS